jgi:tripartite-type tricarboxylate transporter receptor subunit TctC
MSTTLQVLAASVILALASNSTFAQGSGKRPVRVLVGSPPGGPSDIQIRLLLPKLTEALGQTLIVDNRASNNGIMAADIAAKSPPDGHTFAVGNSGTHAVNASLYLKLPYDPVRDFTPVSQFSTTGMVVAANARLPGTSIHDLVAYAKRNPGKLNVAIPGATGELAGDALWAQLKLQMTNVPYKGSAPSELALVSGEADLSLLTPLATLAHIQAGRLKAYGITSTQRSPVLPDVPTLAEQGVEGYEFAFWNGLFAPARTPDSAVRAAHRGIVQALQVPEVKERFRQLGLVIVGNSPEEFSAVVKRDVEKFRKIVIESGIPRL